jgi:hypothetical protein
VKLTGDVAQPRSGSPREQMAELIRVAIRSARAEGQTVVADELISILEDIDRKTALERIAEQKKASIASLKGDAGIEYACRDTPTGPATTGGGDPQVKLH